MTGAPLGPVVALIAERRHLANPTLRAARRRLVATGCQVPFIVPGEERLYAVPAERPAWDAALSRGRDLAGLGLLAAAEALGVRAVNRSAAIELVRNKIAMQAVLREHGLPLPRTWFAAHADVFRAIPPTCFPLVVKPFDGDGARGLALLTTPDDVDRLPRGDGRRELFLAQEFLETDGWDLKLYGIGNQVWAVRKPSPVRFTGPGPARISHVVGAEMVAVDATLRQLTTAMGIRTATVHPRAHDLRHSFAVHTLIRWLRDGGSVDERISELSTYLGHVSPAGTYWYLTAVPELLELAADRLQLPAGVR